MYSIALGQRLFKWKMLSLSGPKALLFLELLVALINRSADLQIFPLGLPRYYGMPAQLGAASVHNAVFARNIQ